MIKELNVRYLSFLILGALLPGIFGILPRDAVQEQVRPRFEQAPCPFPLGPGMIAGKTVRCGYLEVPADRTTPNGRTLRLAVTIFKSASHTPPPDPVVVLQGGPGLPLLSIAAHMPLSALFSSFAPGANRDLILLDQRGTGYSQQRLSCPALAAAGYRAIVQFRPLDQKVTAAQRLSVLLRAERQCRARLVHAGIDLAAYTVAEDAADVRDLRLALGYRTWNLHATSYGTRVAMDAMRLDPAGIRSVVLDSALPLQRTAPFDILPQTAQAFATVFAACAADTPCAVAYPHVASVFEQVVARLNAHPVPMPILAVGARGLVPTGHQYPVPANGETLVETAFGLLQGGAASMLPEMIFDLQKGDTTLFAQAYAATQSSLPFNAGTYLSVVCAEDAPYTSRQALTTAARRLPASLRSTFLPALLDALTECAAWQVSAVLPAEKAPVHSVIPTLLLAGQIDPLTAPANATLIAQGLPKSITLTFPHTGHGVTGTGPCPARIIAAFLDHPGTKPDTSCIVAMRGFHFLGTGGGNA
jgi:pimeloyl-ACP methyl ester carboxylesterase